MERTQFAELSFERDKSVGLYEAFQTFSSIPKDEREAYLEEADMYLGMPTADWPEDILEKVGS